MNNIKRFSSILILVLVFQSTSFAQSFWFGVKGGGGLSFQNWTDFTPNPLLAPNVDLLIESFSEDNKGALYSSLGYHVRGSSIRAFDFQGSFFGNQGFRFNNLTGEAGFKKTLNVTEKITPYYHFGLRGEFTLSNNLMDYDRFQSPFYPSAQLVNRFVYGVSFGGGFDKSFSEFIKGFFEVTFQPDLNNQYYQPQINNVIDPFTLQKINLQERAIRNVSIEFKVGIKFLRKVIYY